MRLVAGSFVHCSLAADVAQERVSVLFLIWVERFSGCFL
jgi:hypothetical protein